MSDELKVLVIGDPHLRVKYIRTVNSFIAQINNLVKAKEPDFVVILGDVFHDHERVHESCFSRAMNWFKEIAKYTNLYILVGNHDRPNNGHFQTENHFFTGIKGHENIHVIDTARFVAFGKGNAQLNFVFTPYVPNGRFEEALDSTKHDWKKVDAIFAHQEFKGVHMGAQVSENGDPWDDRLPLVISGHVHEYQTVGEKIIYVGTPFQTTYAEKNDKGVFLFTFGSQIGATRIRLNLRVKMTKTLTTAELRDFQIPKGDMDLRLVITGTKEEVEGAKRTGIYKKLSEIKWIKLVLRPTFTWKPELRPHQRSYIDALYTDICEDTKLVSIYNEVKDVISVG